MGSWDHGISWELMGEGALRGKIGVLVTEWRVTFLDALHKDSSPQSLAAHQRVLFSWRKRKQYHCGAVSVNFHEKS